jgi:hypothetical protein
MDREGHREGTAEVAVETAPQQSGIGLSSLIPVDRVEPVNGTADAADPLIFDGKRVVPRLAPGANPEETLIYFVACPNSSNSAKPMLREEYFNAGRTFAEKTTELPPANATGAIPMYVTAAPRPGDSALKITVFQGSDSASDILNHQSHAK